MLQNYISNDQIEFFSSWLMKQEFHRVGDAEVEAEVGV